MPMFRTQSRLLAACVLTLALARAGADKPRTPVPAKPAAQYPLHDAHDGITIAAEPGDVEETRPNTRLDYFHHGFLPMRVIVTNDTADDLSLDDARILFVASDGFTRNAASDEELQRRLFSAKSAAGSKVPLPLPIPPITIHHAPVDKKILADDQDFGFPSTTVKAHATVAGYLFYDTREIDEPVLEHATLELRKVRWSKTNKELAAFEIGLKPSAVEKR
jgi:hypothetical protein